METSEKSYVAMILLCFFLGWLGVHRFYSGKVGTGILMLIVVLITMGIGGIWILIDFILIVCGAFKDKKGLLIRPRNIQ